ncbi:hypothetical protein P9126_18385 [Bacillus glycinifermentans]|uniref:hypothetical protein n=1 Tax=Bacillus glycinifermentans TaxID=1664069 RepID=UPI002DC0516B|nr:hypothetical protein [Bacillus glycinifermentans]MEC3608931.1 hypothetical protein [Bacillus glycinifermentans]
MMTGIWRADGTPFFISKSCRDRSLGQQGFIDEPTFSAWRIRFYCMLFLPVIGNFNDVNIPAAFFFQLR